MKNVNRYTLGGHPKRTPATPVASLSNPPRQMLSTQQARKRSMRVGAVLVATLALCGCSTNTNTVIARPGVPLLVLKPFTAPAGSTATEVAKGKFVVNQGKVDVSPGAVIVVPLKPVATAPAK